MVTISKYQNSETSFLLESDDGKVSEVHTAESLAHCLVLFYEYEWNTAEEIVRDIATGFMVTFTMTDTHYEYPEAK